MIKLNFAVAAAVAVAAGSVAHAAPADAAFSGPFVGIQGGWQQDRLSLRSFDGLGDVGYGSRSADGFGYGGQVGYDYRLPSNLVVGVEAAVTGRTGHDNLIDGFGNVTSERYGRTVDATARLGYVFPATGGLGYVRGGYANTRLLLTDPVGRQAYNRDGYTVGVGYEQAVARHVSARLEYNYADYGRDDVPSTAIDYGYAGSQARLRSNAVTAGLNFHF